jgi:3-methyladenine DNA glycosylase AlkD
MKKAFSAQSEAGALLDQLKQHVDPAYRQGLVMSAPTELLVYGVRVPDLRKITRAWRRAHRDIAQENLEAVLEALWNGQSREERKLVIYLLLDYERRIPDLPQSLFERWRRDIDSWEMADGVGWILGLWLVGDPGTRLDYLWHLIADEDVWSRRVALVATIPINRNNPGFTIPDLTLELVERIKQERHPMMTKAISWVLREMIKNHRDRVIAYLDANREVLARHVVREVDNKLQTGLKSGKGGKS